MLSLFHVYCYGPSCQLTKNENKRLLVLYVLSAPLTPSSNHTFHEKSVSIIVLRWMKDDNKWHRFELHPCFQLHSELH